MKFRCERGLIEHLRNRQYVFNQSQKAVLKADEKGRDDDSIGY